MKQKSSISLAKALTLSLGELGQPVVTKYQLGILIFHLYKTASYHGNKIGNLKVELPDLKAYNYQLKNLLDLGVISKISKTASSVFGILGKESATPAEIACSIDPFAYLSHLSAMEYHGITNRMPKILYISTPAKGNWKDLANELMHKELGDDISTYRQNKLPLMSRIKLEKIKNTSIHTYSSLHYGAYRAVKDTKIKVSTIGRTFLDMIRSPDLCGGIYHIIEVYQEYSKPYLNLIIDEVDRHGKPIDKVRAGYILEEKCGIRNNHSIESWLKVVQRGGSRKLDPTQEYSSTYSERWCLSLNIFEQEKTDEAI